MVITCINKGKHLELGQDYRNYSIYYLLLYSNINLHLFLYLGIKLLFFSLYKVNTSLSPILRNIQFSRVQSLSHVQLCDSMNRSRPGLPVHHQLLEFTQTHVHRVSDDIHPSQLLSSPSLPALNSSQHRGLFQVNSSHEVAKVLEFQLQHQSFQWTPRTDLL